MIANAETQVATFDSVKSDINQQMMEIHTNIERVKATITRNVRSQSKPEGVLTSQQAEYLGCLELGHVRLEELLRADEAKWA